MVTQSPAGTSKAWDIVCGSYPVPLDNMQARLHACPTEEPINVYFKVRLMLAMGREREDGGREKLDISLYYFCYTYM